ncbi:MAG: MoaD family protein [Anaerolineae bacterium]|nr:MoaD family protein [Anaerolineae bacterium]
MPTVKFFGSLRDHVPASSLEMAGAAGSTVQAVLSDLCADNEALHTALFKDGELWPHVRVMVNGRDIALGQGLNTRLDESDQLAIFPPVAGG